MRINTHIHTQLYSLFKENYTLLINKIKNKKLKTVPTINNLYACQKRNIYKRKRKRKRRIALPRCESETN